MHGGVVIRGLGCGVALATAACQTPVCNPSIDPAGRYQADLIERYDEQSQYAYTIEIGVKPAGTSGRCGGADGVGPGASLIFDGTGAFDRPQGSCRGVTADLTPPPPELAIVGPPSNLGVTAAMTVYGEIVSMHDVEFAGCAGTLGLAVVPGAGSRSRRHLSGAGAGCLSTRRAVQDVRARRPVGHGVPVLLRRLRHTAVEALTTLTARLRSSRRRSRTTPNPRRRPTRTI